MYTVSLVGGTKIKFEGETEKERVETAIKEKIPYVKLHGDDGNYTILTDKIIYTSETNY